MAAKRLPKHGRAAREATLTALMDASDQLDPGSVERIFLRHAGDHCIEQWLSEGLGYQVRIIAWTEGGPTVERVG